jgi:hypothetical protein
MRRLSLQKHFPDIDQPQLPALGILDHLMRRGARQARRNGLPLAFYATRLVRNIISLRCVDGSLAATRLFEGTMPKALESMIDLYVKLKERKALENLLDARRRTYSDFEQLNSSKRFLDELAEEMEMIKAGLDRIERGQTC